jgi:hypothetical protein
MKSILSRCLLCLVLTFALVGPLLALTPEEAAAKEGETVSVTSQCSNAKKIKSGAVFLNFGGDYPNQTFSVYISPADAAAFTDIETYSGKTYTVTGKIEIKKGKPSMQLKTPDQIVAAPDATDAPAVTPAAK